MATHEEAQVSGSNPDLPNSNKGGTMNKMGYTPKEIAEMAMTQGYEELSKAVKRLGVSAIEGIDAQDDVIARCINALIDRVEKLEKSR